jgi:amino acid transporter
MTAHSGVSTPPKLNKVQRFLGDGLLAYVLYSFVFVGLWNSCTNAMQFGRMVLVAYGANYRWVQVGNNTTLVNGTSTYHPIQGDYIQVSDPTVPYIQPDVDASLVRFIGVAALSILCLIQLASPRAGRRLNKLAAIVKIASVIALIGVIARYAVASSDGPATSWSDSRLDSNWDWSKALMAVIFSFDGWENATFVSESETVSRTHQMSNIESLGCRRDPSS